MKNQRQTPEIRFDGFTDDWEQRKLGELASSFEYGLNTAAKEYDGENKYIRITDIDDNTHEFLTDALTSPDINLTGAENYKLTEGDILFARTGASVGKSYIYKDSDGLVYYAGFLIRARIKEEYDAEDNTWEETDSCWGFFNSKFGSELIEDVARNYGISETLYDSMEEIIS